MRKCFVLVIVVFVMNLYLIGADASERIDTYFLEYLNLEKNYGPYIRWPSVAKEQLVKRMQECSLVIDLGFSAEEVLNLYYGDLERVDLFNVMQREWGEFDNWTVEQKAKYSDWSGVDEDNSFTPQYILPEGEEISQKEAIEIANGTLLREFELSESDLKSRIIDVDFLKTKLYGDFGNDPLWVVRFRDQEINGLVYEVVLDRRGKELVIQAPRIQPILIGNNDLTNINYVEPGPHDIGRGSAIDSAIKEIAYRYNAISEELRECTIDAQYLMHKRFCLGYEPVWYIEFRNNQEELEYKVLIGYDGEVIDVASGEKEFIKTQRSTILIDDIVYPHGIVNEEGYRFDEWSLEDKEKFSKEWIPYIENYIKSNPYYPNHNRALYLATRHVYGLPDGYSISQEEALITAQRAIVQAGADEATVYERETCFYYDITEVERPLWKIDFGISKTQVGENWLYPFRAIIDAKSGDVLDAYNAKGKLLPLY